MFAWIVFLFLGFDIWVSTNTSYIGMAFVDDANLAVILFFLCFTVKTRFFSRYDQKRKGAFYVFLIFLVLFFILELMGRLFYVTGRVNPELYLYYISHIDYVLFYIALFNSLCLILCKAWRSLEQRLFLRTSLIWLFYFGVAIMGYFKSMLCYSNWGIVSLVAVFYLMQAVDSITRQEVRRAYV